MRIYRYRWGVGMWSYVFHRISGLALVLYLTMHIWVVHNIQKGQESYDALMQMLNRPIFRLGEVALLAAVLYHAINGMRLVVMDSGFWMSRYRLTFWAVFAVCAVLGVAGGLFILFFLG